MRTRGSLIALASSLLFASAGAVAQDRMPSPVPGPVTPPPIVGARDARLALELDEEFFELAPAGRDQRHIGPHEPGGGVRAGE